MARIAADVLKECERNDLESNRDAIVAGVRVLVANGRLEAQGNLAWWSYIEVRLRDTPPIVENDGSSPERTHNEAEPDRSIAGRVLIITVGRREVEVPITIYAPIDKGDHWRCAFEIGWPDKPKLGAGNGIDAMQALLIALKFIGTELYTSKAHAAGKLKCPGLRAGYGFPLPQTIRDLAEGEDRYL